MRNRRTHPAFPGSPNPQGYAARAVVHAKCDSASGGSHACRTHSARDASFSPPVIAGFFTQRLLALMHEPTSLWLSYTETAAKTPLNATADAALRCSTPRQLT